MKRARRRHQSGHPGVTPIELFVMLHGALPKDDRACAGNHLGAFMLLYPSGDLLDRLRALWACVRDETLRTWTGPELPWAERALNEIDAYGYLVSARRRHVGGMSHDAHHTTA